MTYLCPVNWTGRPAGCDKNGHGPHRCTVELTEPFVGDTHSNHLCACDALLPSPVVVVR